jgi:hypothetical protein
VDPFYPGQLPPSDVAAIFWLKNRNPQNCRDAWQIEASVGKYIISDKAMTPEQWIADTIVDAEPVAIEDKTEEK